MVTKTDFSDEHLFDFQPYDDKNSERIGYSNYSYWSSTWKVFTKNKLAFILLVSMVIILVFTVIQPYLPGQKIPTHIYTDESGIPLRNLKPSIKFWLGTNSIGQDLWSRIWSGTRTSLFIGLMVALCEAIVGIFVGSIWGYVRKLDRIITEIYNIINNIPTSIVLILFTYIMRPGIFTMIFAMCITGWITMARFIRNQIIIIRDREYNLASRCLGTPTNVIIMKNLLPYLISVIMLRMALAIPAAIGWEVFLTYLGLGLPVSMPSLGNLINEGRSIMMFADLRYQLIFPAIILSFITVSFYILGNSFSDAADPRNHV